MRYYATWNGNASVHILCPKKGRHQTHGGITASGMNRFSNHIYNSLMKIYSQYPHRATSMADYIGIRIYAATKNKKASIR